MSKRNLILLIIVLVIIVASVFGFFLLYQPKNPNNIITEGTNFIADFLPFGKSKTITKEGDPEKNINTSDFIPFEEGTVINSSLKKISSFPIAGYGIFMKERFKEVTNPNPTPTLPLSGEGVSLPPAKNGSGGLIAPPTEFAPAIRYVNKATGNIYQTFADTIDERKFSSTIIPKVQEAFFGNKGESVIMRYLKKDGKTIETFVGALEKEYLGADSIGTNDVKGSFLPENISDVSVSSDASKIFYLFETGDNAIGINYTLQTNSKTQIFDSPYTEWLSQFPNNKMVTVTTKPSFDVKGYMYAINGDKKPASTNTSLGGDFNKILGGINGLTTLTSPDSKTVLYADSNLSLNKLNIETKNSDSIGIKTLPEKCVWGPLSDVIYCAVPKFIEQSQYPDSWYQGETSFSDEIWKVDIISGNTTLLIDPLTAPNGEEIDAIKLGIDENQDYLFFVNKKDSYLWRLILK